MEKTTCRPPLRVAVLLSLVLAGGLAAAQTGPAPRINRNPDFRDDLPPASAPAPDPRDSSTRPVQPPTALPDDGRTVVVPSADGTVPASAPTVLPQPTAGPYQPPPPALPQR